MGQGGRGGGSWGGPRFFERQPGANQAAKTTNGKRRSQAMHALYRGLIRKASQLES